MYDINSALERLEQNLADVDAARKQVDGIVASNANLQKVVAQYAATLNSTQAQLASWIEVIRQNAGAISNEFANSVQKINEACDLAVQSFQNNCSQANQVFAAEIAGSLVELKQENADFNAAIGRFDSLSQSFTAATSQVQAIKQTLENLSADLHDSQTQQDRVLDDIKSQISTANKAVDALAQNLASSISCVRADVAQVSNSISSLSFSVGNLGSEMKANFQDNQKKMAEMEADLASAVRINRWIMIAGFIAMAAMVYVF